MEMRLEHFSYSAKEFLMGRKRNINRKDFSA